LPLIQRFLDKNAYIGILRVKRDVGKESNLGFIVTSYNFIEKHNQLGGIDGRIKISKQKTLNFQVLGTTSRMCFFRAGRRAAPAQPFRRMLCWIRVGAWRWGAPGPESEFLSHREWPRLSSQLQPGWPPLLLWL
jgi:hypothetical protein